MAYSYPVLSLMSLASLASLACLASAAPPPRAPAKIVFIAGPPSHGPGDHEYHAGLMLLAECLKDVKGIETVVVANGWPQDPAVLSGARSVVLFMDGGGAHPLLRAKERMDTMRRLMKEGVGLVCIHYTVEIPKGEASDLLTEWLGGFYENGYSTNPMNEIDLTPAPLHPVTRGVGPFHLLDEWYYKIRFRPDDRRVMPVLTAMLPKDNPSRETLGWVTERADGGRAFGFTGGHFHKNWGVPEFRRIVLNAILWTAKLPVPRGGVESTVTPEQLKENMDKK